MSDYNLSIWFPAFLTGSASILPSLRPGKSVHSSIYLHLFYPYYTTMLLPAQQQPYHAHIIINRPHRNPFQCFRTLYGKKPVFRCKPPGQPVVPAAAAELKNQCALLAFHHVCIRHRTQIQIPLAFGTF